MGWPLISLFNFAYSMLSYHYSHAFEDEPMGGYFLGAGVLLPTVVGEMMGLERRDILRMVPWCLISTSILCSLWYRLFAGKQSIPAIDTETEKTALNDLGGDIAKIT